MNYFGFNKCDCANGWGIRVVVWFAGCNHKCPGCHNPMTWNENSGEPFTEESKELIYEELSKWEYKGITLSGGDPLFPNNRKEVLQFAKEIKERFNNKDIWLYTGYSWEDIKDLEGIENIDVIVDGEYKEELSHPSPEWRGSINQRIIDVKRSLEQNKVITYIATL